MPNTRNWLLRSSVALALLFICFQTVSPVVAQTPEAPRVVLLLHGMNSRPDTWDAFLKDLGADAPNISKGVLSKKAKARRGIYYYAVRFGAFDKSSGREGLDGIEAGSNTSGDFESYSTLGKEVRLAVQGILEEHPNAEVVLVGHSRGGIAGRAFLQDEIDSNAKASVVGFLTLGAPHDGSHLGRIYPYLETHSRFDDNKTWNFADLARTFIGLDVRRPTIGDLATDSSAMRALNRRIGRLPVEGIKYQTYVYSGLALGYFKKNVNIFADFGPVGISSDGKKYILDGNSQKELDGDGFVESVSQRFDRLDGVPRNLDVEMTRVRGGILHTEEPERTGDIIKGMKSLVDWDFR